MNIIASGADAPSATAHKYLGLGEAARSRLEELAGRRPVLSWLQTDTKTAWNNSHSTSTLDAPMFASTTWRSPDPDDPSRWMHLADGIWIDIDSQDISDSITALNQTTEKLQELDIPLNGCYVFASGSKGFHVFLPIGYVQPKINTALVKVWPWVCKRFVLDWLAVVGTDLGLYANGRGHLIRQTNVKRDNGAFKVPMAWGEALALDPASYALVCSTPRPWIEVERAAPAPKAMAAWEKSVSHCSKEPKRRPVVRQQADRPRILALLKQIDPAVLDYTDWLRVGCALKSAWPGDDALALWVAHSRQDRRRFRPGACESRWEGLNAGSVGIGTLVVLARGAK